MTTILYHANDQGAFLAADTLRHNTSTGATSRVRKVFSVAAGVLLAGGGISNGVAHLRGGLRHHLSQTQEVDLAGVLFHVLEGIGQCYAQGNSERVQKGLDPLPLCIFLAGIDENNIPTIEYIEQNKISLVRSTFRDAIGGLSVQTPPAMAASIEIYEEMRDGNVEKNVHLADWAFESVLRHQNMFPGQVAAPVDCGIVTPEEAIDFATHYSQRRMSESFTVKGLIGKL